VALRAGLGVKKDPVGGAKYFKMSADQGNSDGQDEYGWALRNGFGAQEDFAHVAKYFKLSADQGHSDGPFTMGGHFEMDGELRRMLLKLRSISKCRQIRAIGMVWMHMVVPFAMVMELRRMLLKPPNISNCQRTKAILGHSFTMGVRFVMVSELGKILLLVSITCQWPAVLALSKSSLHPSTHCNHFSGEYVLFRKCTSKKLEGLAGHSLLFGEYLDRLEYLHCEM
jgi:hypothetical protein